MFDFVCKSACQLLITMQHETSARHTPWEDCIMMTKGYEDRTVYDAIQERFHYLFQEFENIYVSFSGGKDSGVLLNLLLDFKRRYYPDRRIGVFHQDFEAQYSVTTEYVTRTFQALEGECDLYWVCLPMATRTALSSYEMYWGIPGMTKGRIMGTAATGISLCDHNRPPF